MSGTTANMNASLTLRLQDRLSMGLAALKSRLDGLRDSAERIGALGALGAAFAVGAPIRAAATLDDQLRAIAINAGKSGAAAETYINELRRKFQRLAIETAQTTEAVVAGAGLMIQRGMPSALIDKLLPISAKVATAASADLKDVAGVAESLNASLGVLPDQLERALAMLVVAAKEGKVELKDMAREFPALAAAANNFGLKGMDGVMVLASALQVAAKASATPAEASNNLANLFASLTRPETLKNFDKMGVDLDAVMKDAGARGINPLEAAIAKVIQLTRGDPVRLGRLIGDMQAGRALLPFLRDSAAEYLRIREVVGGANLNVLTDDFLTRMAGAAAKLTIAMERLSQITERVGRELSKSLDLLLVPLATFTGLIDRVDGIAPDLIGNMVRFAGAVLILLAAITAILLVLPALVTVVKIVVAGFRIVWLAFVATARVVQLLAVLFKALAVGGVALSLPVLAVVGAVTALGIAAVTVWAYWERFEGVWAAMWASIEAFGRGFLVFLDGVFKLEVARSVEGLMMMWGGFRDFFVNLWIGLTEVLDIWWAGVSGWIAMEVGPMITAFMKLWEGLEVWFSGLWSRMMEPINRWIAAVSDAWDRARRMLGFAPGEAAPAGVAEGARAAGSFVRIDSASRIAGEIVVRAAPGTAIDETRSLTPGLRIQPSTPPDRGRVQERA